jgi:hypothetical protein
MNPGPILIIRNTFPTLARVFLFPFIIKSKNTKKNTFCNYIKNTKTHLFIALVYFLLFSFYYFVLLAIIIPKSCAWQPVGGVGDARQGVCFAACLTRMKRAFLTDPESSILTPSHPCGEIFSCYNTLHLESQRSGTLLSIITVASPIIYINNNIL